MKDNLGAADYFKRQKGWDRCFSLMKNKWESLGRIGGNVLLENCSIDEKESVGKFLGKIIDEENIKISLNEFDDSLKKTKYYETTFIELLEAYYGVRLITNKEQKEKNQQKKQYFFNYIIEVFKQKQEYGKISKQWILDVWNQKEYGYTTIIREYNKNEENAKTLLINIGKTLKIIERQQENSESDGISLAVLSARVTGNPHYLDRGTIAGNVLVSALCYIQKQEYPKSGIMWKRCLLESNILSDNISSQVVIYGIHLKNKNGLHMGVEEFCKRKEPLVLTSHNTKQIISAFGENNKVFIVENEMVFETLIEILKETSFSIICTSGQLHAVAYELIYFLVKNNNCIYYSGDLDPEGLMIADRLWQKHPENINIWRMSSKDYVKGISCEKISDKSLAMLPNIQNEILKKTAKLMESKKYAGYQENLLDDLKKDIVKLI